MRGKKHNQREIQLVKILQKQIQLHFLKKSQPIKCRQYLKFKDKFT